MQNKKDDQLDVLVMEELELVTGGTCWAEYVWADAPRLVCRQDPWDGPTYHF